MSGRTVHALPAGLIVLTVALAMSPSFGQGTNDPGESRQERWSSAGQEEQDGPGLDSAGPAALDDALGSSDSSDGFIVVGPNVRVNAPQQVRFGRSETTIAAGEDGRRIIIGWNDARGFCGPPFNATPPCTPPNPPGLSGFGVSTDGGATFTEGGAPPVFVVDGVPVFTRGDPWLAADRNGHTFFYANLAVDARNSNASLGVSVHRGRFQDGRFSWFDVHVFNAENAPRDFYDKEAITVDERGRLGIVTVTNFKELCGIARNGFGQIELWRTDDGGTEWEGPVIVGPEMPDSVAACGNMGTSQQSSVPAIGPDREVYVAWQQGPTFTASGASTNAKIVVARSLDGGLTFDQPKTVATINSMRGIPPVGYNRDRINDHPRITVATRGPHRGRVFVSFYSAVSPATPASISPCPSSLPVPAGSQCRGQKLTSSQVFVSYSDDLGLTWRPPVAVASALPDTSTGVKRWWPVVSVQRDGDVGVVYYESVEGATAAGPCLVRVATVRVGGVDVLRFRTGPARSSVNTYLARSTNGGATFDAPVRVSSQTSDWCATRSNITPNYGDYIGATRANGRVLATWADGRSGVADTFFAPIFIQGTEAEQP